MPKVAREATALRRSALSRPIALAIDHGVIRKGLTVLDYGCGHGGDYTSLQELGIDALGWDPYYLPGGSRRESDVVSLGFVLNVIEDAAERDETLRRAYALARRSLVVAVRVDKMLIGESLADGILTKRNTFQKLYTQEEFREYVQRVLGTAAIVADLGIAYVFRTDEERARYLANRTFSRRLQFDVDLHHRFRHDPLAQRLIQKTGELGRLPDQGEFPRLVVAATKYGGLARLARLVLASVDEEAFLGSVRERAEDILTYLAKLRLAGVRVPRLSQLPKPVQHDIRATWGSLSSARDEALVLLFAMGKPRVFHDALRSVVIGKRIGEALYAHSSAIGLLPPVFRMLEYAARTVVGEVACEVVKFSKGGRAVSFLRYPEFDTDAHPALRSSVRVVLPHAAFELREYSDANPFILHRKELLVGSDYPRRALFAELTKAEEEAGLLGGKQIGTRCAWLERLRTQRCEIVGHRVCKLVRL